MPVKATIVYQFGPVALNSRNLNRMNLRPNGGGEDQTSDLGLNFICFRHRLVIVEVGDNDFGNYSCLAENDLGKTRGYIELSGERDI